MDHPGPLLQRGDRHSALRGLPECAGWEELVGRKAEHFAYYEVFAALRFAIIMARLAGQMKHYEILPADHPMDAENLASLILARVLEENGAR